MRLMSLIAIFFISIVFICLLTFFALAPRNAASIFNIVKRCFCFRANPTLRNHKERVDFATGTIFSISLYEKPSFLKATALLFSFCFSIGISNHRSYFYIILWWFKSVKNQSRNKFRQQSPHFAKAHGAGGCAENYGRINFSV